MSKPSKTTKQYVGRRTDDRTEVVVQIIGPTGVLSERPLRHVVRHSPTGLEWGYNGSGPADLARSLLIDALGDEALCPVCGGDNVLVWDDDEGDFIKPANAEVLADARARQDAGETERVTQCFDCFDGFADLPYQQLKWDVIGHLTRDEWTVPAANVVAWFQALGART